MKKQTFCLVVLVGGAAFAGLESGCTKPNAKTNTRQTLQALYDEQSAALNTKNLDEGYAYFAPDCVFIGAQDVRYDLARERREVARVFSQAKSKITFASAITNITPNTPNAPRVTVTVTRHITSTILWQKTMQPASIDIKTEIKDVWGKGANGWQIKREKIKTPQTTVNGKPFSLTQSGD